MSYARPILKYGFTIAKKILVNKVGKVAEMNRFKNLLKLVKRVNATNSTCRTTSAFLSQEKSFHIKCDIPLL